MKTHLNILAACALVGIIACEPMGEGFFTTEVHGTVTYPGGDPVAGQKVHALHLGRCEDPLWSTTEDSAFTDQAGAYTVEVGIFGGGSGCTRGCVNLQVTPTDPTLFDTTRVLIDRAELCIDERSRTLRDIVVEVP